MSWTAESAFHTDLVVNILVLVSGDSECLAKPCKVPVQKAGDVGMNCNTVCGKYLNLSFMTKYLQN